MDFIKKTGRITFCLALAVPSAVLGKLFPVVGGPVFAILIGMILALVIKKTGFTGMWHKIYFEENIAICRCTSWIRTQFGGCDGDGENSLCRLLCAPLQHHW